MPNHLPLQTTFCPVLPTIVGNVDYQRFEVQLKRINEILLLGGVEDLFVQLSLDHWQSQHSDCHLSASQQLSFQEASSRALRCMILKGLLREDYRGLSRRLAECPLFQWFTGSAALDQVRVPSKSTLHRYLSWMPKDKLDLVVVHLIKAAAQQPEEDVDHALGLTHQIELDNLWMDGTCLKANIHYPVDWLLLRDATRTLMKATILIRNHGLKHRMQAPEVFLSQMNRLCIQMTQGNRFEPETKKHRKAVLRQVKKLSQLIGRHAARHRKLLEKHWQETDWQQGHVNQVLERIQGVLDLLPKAIKQAHERIIGERPINNKDKILSLYEGDVQVIVRGKASTDVEFGNTLLIAEQAQGLVVDWKLYKDTAPSDSRQLPESMDRVEERFGIGCVEALGGDRGFDSAKNRKLLASKEIFNGLCPKSIQDHKRRKHSGRFKMIQRRRAQIEGRIAILKNDFLGSPCRSKGFENRDQMVTWSVLTHNLWVLARLEKKNQPIEDADSIAA